MNKQTKGFTIIEVVLVLAIAGLIFLMVFLALPALQRSQRDAQRRSDAAMFASQVAQFQTSNGGKTPQTAQVGNFVSSYLTDWKDPSTGDPYPQAGFNSATPSQVGRWAYYQGASCSGETLVQSTANPLPQRKFAFIMKLEGAGYVCKDENEGDN